jgi:hypothetical protein
MRLPRFRRSFFGKPSRNPLKNPQALIRSKAPASSKRFPPRKHVLLLPSLS